MTSYDRYLEYVRSPPFYYHRPCQHVRHQLQQLDEAARGAGCGTAGLDVELLSSNAPSVVGRQQAASPTPAADVSDASRRRAAPPAFTIDAILSSAGKTTGSGVSAISSAAEWSRVQSPVVQQTTSGAENTTQLTRGTGIIVYY